MTTHLVSVSDLMNKIRKRSDQDKSKFISDSELISLIDMAHTDLYSRLIEKDYYNVMWTKFTGDGSKNLWELPGNFFKIIKIIDSHGNSLKNSNFEEIDLSSNDYATVFYPYTQTMVYSIVGACVMINPAPSEELTLYYVPRPEAITTTTQLIDPIIFEEYLILYCMIRILNKTEEDSKNTYNLWLLEVKRVDEFGRSRNRGAAERVRSNIRNQNDFTPWGYY